MLQQHSFTKIYTRLKMEEFIKKLEQLLFEFNISAQKNSDELNAKYGWPDNDFRVYFFNAASQIAFLHGLTIYFLNSEVNQNENHWRERQKYFKPNGNYAFEKTVFYHSGLVRDNFFFDYVMLIEHVLRIFSGEIISYKTEKIIVVKDQLIKKLNLDKEYKKLFDILFKIRNTIHNGGLHSDNKPSITYKGKTFEFQENNFSQSNFESIRFLFSETFEFMKELFNHEESLKVRLLESPYPNIFKPSY